MPIHPYVWEDVMPPLDVIMEVLEMLPWYGDLILVMGTMRAIMKPVSTVIETVVKATPSPADDEALYSIKRSNSFKILRWIVDYLGSIKI
jgi:hypothetical protein